jgi:hypothetical protein
MTKPKLCPKENCNGIALLHSEYESNEVIDDNLIQEFQYYLVKCTKCNFTNGDFKKPKEAIKYWNLRSKEIKINNNNNSNKNNKKGK